MDVMQLMVSVFTGLMTGVILTQLTGKGHRTLSDGILAWFFIPLCLAACMVAMGSEDAKTVFVAFFKTLMNSPD